VDKTDSPDIVSTDNSEIEGDLLKGGVLVEAPALGMILMGVIVGGFPGEFRSCCFIDKWEKMDRAPKLLALAILVALSVDFCRWMFPLASLSSIIILIMSTWWTTIKLDLLSVWTRGYSRNMAL